MGSENQTLVLTLGKANTLLSGLSPVSDSSRMDTKLTNSEKEGLAVSRKQHLRGAELAVLNWSPVTFLSINFPSPWLSNNTSLGLRFFDGKRQSTQDLPSLTPHTLHSSIAH